MIGHLAKAGFACGNEVLGGVRAITLVTHAMDHDELDGFKFFHFRTRITRIERIRTRAERSSARRLFPVRW